MARAVEVELSSATPAAGQPGAPPGGARAGAPGGRRRAEGRETRTEAAGVRQADPPVAHPPRSSPALEDGPGAGWPRARVEAQDVPDGVVRRRRGRGAPGGVHPVHHLGPAAPPPPRAGPAAPAPRRVGQVPPAAAPYEGQPLWFGGCSSKRIPLRGVLGHPDSVRVTLLGGGVGAFFPGKEGAAGVHRVFASSSGVRSLGRRPGPGRWLLRRPRAPRLRLPVEGKPPPMRVCLIKQIKPPPRLSGAEPGRDRPAIPALDTGGTPSIGRSAGPDKLAKRLTNVGTSPPNPPDPVHFGQIG